MFSRLRDAVGPLLLVVAVWLLPWVLFAFTVAGNVSSRAFVWIGAASIVAANFALLLLVFLRPRPLPTWAIATGFIMTFAALVAAYASADYSSAHHHVAVHGVPVLEACYRNASGNTELLSPVAAIYASLGTITTAGAGEISAHSHACRWMTSGQLAISFPLMGLAIGGVAARVFRQLGRGAG